MIFNSGTVAQFFPSFDCNWSRQGQKEKKTKQRKSQGSRKFQFVPDENTDTISTEIAVFWSLILSTSMYWLVTAAICKRLTKSLPKHTSPQYHVKGSPLCYCHLEKREPAQSLHCSKRERQHIHYFFSIE